MGIRYQSPITKNLFEQDGDILYSHIHQQIYRIFNRRPSAEILDQ
ncbi:hypothetical protein [Umezakia ovalisporum]|nr:hypothetical protein [Umezakia ovalisporum]MDH6088944.1 hypothetical protein [Umezakia ovalisporum Ak1311]